MPGIFRFVRASRVPSDLFSLRLMLHYGGLKFVAHDYSEPPVETLIMIPGLGSDAAVWQPTVRELGNEVECYIGDTLLDDSLGAMATRILKDAPPRFALAGVSMGGMVALEIMRAAPERVTRLLLCDTNARPDTAEQMARRRTTNVAMQATSDLGSLAAPAIAYMVHPLAQPSVREELLQMTLRVGVSVYVRQNEAVIARNDLRPVLSTVAAPTLVVVGAEDQMTPVILSQEISDMIPEAVLKIISDCGHLPPIEKPRVVADLIRDWMKW